MLITDASLALAGAFQVVGGQDHANVAVEAVQPHDAAMPVRQCHHGDHAIGKRSEEDSYAIAGADGCPQPAHCAPKQIAVHCLFP